MSVQQVTAAAEPMTLQQKVVDAIAFGSAAVGTASRFMAEKTAQDAKVAELIPQAVKALIDYERIEPGEEKRASDVLKDPVQVLGLLIKLAGHRNTQEAARLGTPIQQNGQTKVASTKAPFNSLTNPNVGARTSEIKESDRVLFRGLKLTPPTP